MNPRLFSEPIYHISHFFKGENVNVFCLQIPKFARNLLLFVMYDGN